MHVLPYLYFEGRCEEALSFYKKAVGAETTIIMRFNESPEPHPPGVPAPGAEKNVMHAEFRFIHLRRVCHGFHGLLLSR